MGHTFGLPFLKQSVCGSAVQDNNSTKGGHKRDDFFPERVGLQLSVCPAPQERLLPACVFSET